MMYWTMVYRCWIPKQNELNTTKRRKSSASSPKEELGLPQYQYRCAEYCDTQEQKITDIRQKKRIKISRRSTLFAFLIPGAAGPLSLTADRHR